MKRTILFIILGIFLLFIGYYIGGKRRLQKQATQIEQETIDELAKDLAELNKLIEALNKPNPQ